MALSNLARTGQSERQPHLFGAAPFTYRQGTATANSDTPPAWTPEMMHCVDYPYYLEEWEQDVLRWIGATRADPHRHGNLLALATGAGARVVTDHLPVDLLAGGRVGDFGDGLGNIHRTGCAWLIFSLKQKFPTDFEALMLRTGMEFFNFTPRRQEHLAELFLRFDMMLDKANRLANLGISYPFRTWMILSVLRTPPKKWAELLKEIGRRFPRDQAEYTTIQQILTRDHAIETNVASLQTRSSGAGATGTYLALGDAEPLPLYLALGGAGANPLAPTFHTNQSQGSPSGMWNSGPTSQSNDSNIIWTLFDLEDGKDGASSWASDEEYWNREDREDPWPQERIDAEVRASAEDPMHKTNCFWQMRKATRRFRAASGKFGPRTKFKRQAVGKRFTKRGPPGPTGRPQRGFFIEET